MLALSLHILANWNVHVETCSRELNNSVVKLPWIALKKTLREPKAVAITYWEPIDVEITFRRPIAVNITFRCPIAIETTYRWPIAIEITYSFPIAWRQLPAGDITTTDNR